MQKKLIVMVCLLLMTVFMVSAAVTTAMAKPPGCNTCAKAGCPTGHCYIDCVGCCFLRLGVVYCYR